MPKRGESFPSPKRPCPECGDDRPFHERETEREEIDSYADRIDYWCPECGTHVGTKTSYCGPEPVRTHNGWEVH